jgi:hypothetical protein
MTSLSPSSNILSSLGGRLAFAEGLSPSPPHSKSTIGKTSLAGLDAELARPWRRNASFQDAGDQSKSSTMAFSSQIFDPHVSVLRSVFANFIRCCRCRTAVKRWVYSTVISSTVAHSLTSRRRSNSPASTRCALTPQTCRWLLHTPTSLALFRR